VCDLHAQGYGWSWVYSHHLEEKCNNSPNGEIRKSCNILQKLKARFLGHTRVQMEETFTAVLMKE
jgi:hypothetical protein